MIEPIGIRFYFQVLSTQHQEILGDISSIFSLLDESLCDEDIPRLDKCLTVLATRLTVHLLQEDRFLYQKLSVRKYQCLHAMTLAYTNKMSDVGEQFDRHIKKWLFSNDIIVNQDLFKEETRAILKGIMKRIQTEETSLFPMLKSEEDRMV